MENSRSVLSFNNENEWFLRCENKAFINEWVKEEENKEWRKDFLQTIRLIKPPATRKINHGYSHFKLLEAFKWKKELVHCFQSNSVNPIYYESICGNVRQTYLFLKPFHLVKVSWDQTFCWQQLKVIFPIPFNQNEGILSFLFFVKVTFPTQTQPYKS